LEGQKPSKKNVSAQDYFHRVKRCIWNDPVPFYILGQDKFVRSWTRESRSALLRRFLCTFATFPLHVRHVF
jgi:hypothetical protein